MEILFKAIDLYNKKKYDKALSLFEKVKEIHGERMIGFYLVKCRKILGISNSISQDNKILLQPDNVDSIDNLTNFDSIEILIRELNKNNYNREYVDSLIFELISNYINILEENDMLQSRFFSLQNNMEKTIGK